jgi:hypothetical protein
VERLAQIPPKERLFKFDDTDTKRIAECEIQVENQDGAYCITYEVGTTIRLDELCWWDQSMRKRCGDLNCPAPFHLNGRHMWKKERERRTLKQFVLPSYVPIDAVSAMDADVSAELVAETDVTVSEPVVVADVEYRVPNILPPTFQGTGMMVKYNKRNRTFCEQPFVIGELVPSGLCANEISPEKRCRDFKCKASIHLQGWNEWQVQEIDTRLKNLTTPVQ